MADTDKIHVIAAHNPGFLLTPNSRKVTAISISSKISHFLPVAPAMACGAVEAILACENHDFAMGYKLLVLRRFLTIFKKNWCSVTAQFPILQKHKFQRFFEILYCFGSAISEAASAFACVLAKTHRCVFGELVYIVSARYIPDNKRFLGRLGTKNTK